MNEINNNAEDLELKFHKLAFHIKREIPHFTLRSKKDSKLMQLLSVLLFFNDDFLDRYITTLYPDVYVPELPWTSHSAKSRISILAHEYVHLKDRKRLGWLFNLLYLSPQVFALLALGAFWNLWWLLALLFLLPLPSPGRAWLEYRGYRMTIAMHWYLTGKQVNAGWLRDQFIKSNYYWMWPFKKAVERCILKVMEDVESGNFLASQIFEIINVLENKE